MLIGDDSLFNDALEQKRAMRAAFTEPDYGDIELPVQSNFDDSLDLEDTQLPFGDPAITTGADGSNDDQNDSQDTTGFNADLKNETASYQVVKPTPDICGVTTTGSSAVGLESSMTDNMAADHSTTQPSSAGVTEPLTKLTTTTAASVAQLDKLVPQFCQKKKPMFGSSKSTRSKNTSKSTKKVNSSPSETLEPQPPALASLLQPLAEEQCSNKENQGNDTDQCVPQNASKMRAPLKTSFNAPKPKSSSNNKILSSDKEGENKNKSQDKKLRKKISETECDKNEEMKVELEEKRVEKKKEKSRKMREAEEKKDERDKKMKEAEEKKAERERKKKEAEGKKAEKEIKKEEAEEKKAERERLRKEAEEKTAERERLKKERQMEIEKKKTECEQKKNYKRLQKSKGDQEKKKKTVKCTSQEKSNTAPEISDNTDSRMSEKETKELVPAQGGQSEAAHTSGKMDTTDPPPLTPETESHTPAKENATTTSHSVSQSSIHSAQRSSGARGKEGDGGVIQPEENCGLPESSNLPVRSAREEGMPEEDGCESEDELSQNQPENIPPPQERANTENMGNKPGEVALGDSDQLSEDEKEPSNSPDERVNTTTSKKADEAKEENKTEEKNEAKEKNETEERNDTVPAVEPGSKTIRIVFGKSQTARSKGKMEEGNGEEERDMEEGKDGGKGKGNQKRENKYFKAPCRNHPAGITHDQREIKSFKAPCRNQPLGKNEAKTLSKDQNRKKENMRRARKRKARSIDDESSGSLESKAKCSRSHNYCGPVWVQCEQPHCLKWRQVRECSDPLSLPDSWTCSMNPGIENRLQHKLF